MSERFDVIAFHDIVGADGDPHTPWKRIGGGSFGVVYSASYLGTQVAVKEVLPNDTYDVAKYFERECVLMKEARHPNIVQYIGLSRSPGADGRIYIISEFVGPNVRSYIADTRKPFPWRLRISFATDIARALAYLHARNCLHRDLKPENLLITDNERIKMCDFGFARIAARNEEEMRRMSYCGTDGYMSPEILLGLDFSLPSDIFSLGVIFAEIASRHLVDSTTFKRSIPSFTLDPQEVRDMASEGCPDRFVQLAIDCTQEDPAHRPDMREVLMRLRLCEQEIIAREEAEQAAAEDKHAKFYSVGSIRGASSLAAVLGSKKASRPGGPPRLPSFQGAVQLGKSVPEVPNDEDEDDDDDDDKAEREVEEALAALEKVGLSIDPNAPDLGVGVDPAHPAQLVSTIRGSSSSAKKSSHLFHGGGTSRAEAVAAARTNTFKVSGHGNPWWSDEDERQSLVSIPSGWVRNGKGSNVDAIAHHGHLADASSSSGRQPLLGGSDSSGVGVNESPYSTSVVRSSKLSQAHGQQTPLGSRLSVLTARNGHAGVDDSAEGDGDVGSTMTVRLGSASGSGSGSGSGSAVGQHHENLDIGELAGVFTPAPLNEGMNLSPAHKNTLTRHAGGGGTASAPQSFIAASVHGMGGPSMDSLGEHDRERSLAVATIASTIYPAPSEELPPQQPPQRTGGGGLRSRLFGRSSDASASSAAEPANRQDDKNSTIKGSSLPSALVAEPISEEAEPVPTPLYHRFSLVKNSTRRPAHMSAAQQAAAAARGVSGGPATGSLLPPAVMLSNALARCWVCGKRIGWKPFCECDDCPMRTHVGCSQLAMPNCQEIVFPPAHGGGAGASSHHNHGRVPSLQPAVYASNSGPRWHHAASALRSQSSSSSSSDPSGSNSGASSPKTDGGLRKVSGASSATSNSGSGSGSDSRSRSKTRSASSRSNSVDVGKSGPNGPSRAAESLAAYAAAAGLVRDNSGNLSASSGDGRAALGQGQGQGNGRPLSPTTTGNQAQAGSGPATQQRSSSIDGKLVKLIKGAKRRSSGEKGSPGTGAAAKA
ncbi:hypothetical protein OC834_005999 [Tilletia horrida]|nr:hypothetical protein OC834_005999 [Tilletia horrida]